MRILITGAGGFVGRALIGALSDQHRIVAMDSASNPFGDLPIRYIEGDLADAALLDEACRDRVDALVHLATVPGGAAEQNPAKVFAVNVGATAALLERVTAKANTPRVLFASSIAVLGDPLPPHVDDATPLHRCMVYGAHKAMIEQWIATLTRRGAIAGLSLRFPGIIARPKGSSGMKSAFMSDVFHAAVAHEAFTCPCRRRRRPTNWVQAGAMAGSICRCWLTGTASALVRQVAMRCPFPSRSSSPTPRARGRCALAPSSDRAPSATGLRRRRGWNN